VIYKATTFTLTCTDGARTASDSVVVNVGSASQNQVLGAYAEQPLSVQFAASRPDLGIDNAENSITLPAPGSVTLSWDAPGAASCTIPETGFGVLDPSGSRQTNIIHSTTSFSLICTNGTQTAGAGITVNVDR
jgi:hypothetical protein